MEFKTGNITVEFTSEEIDAIVKAREIIYDFTKRMRHTDTLFAAWTDDCGVSGELTLDNLGMLCTYLDRFMDVDEVY